MDILKPWLAATIEGELGEALRHREDGTNKHRPTEEFPVLSYDDGSNLRISCAKQGPVVQITKFLTFEEPIQVTLSDSVIRVNASISNQASQQYAKQNRRSLTEGTVGGLLQLYEFEIVATHFGPRDKRLTLYVKDFKSLGSSGSGNFGVAPQAIESREGTKELLKKLADLREHGWDAHSDQSATVSPIRSQPSTQTSEAGNNQDTQLGFATQVPRSNALIASKSKPPNPTTSINFGSTSTAKSVKSLAPLTTRKRGNPLAGTLTNLQVQAAPQRPNSHEALLDLLRSCKSVLPVPEITSEPTTEEAPGCAGASIGPAAIENAFEASRDITLAPIDDNARGASRGTPKRKRQSPDDAPRKKAADDHDFHGIDKDRENLAINHDLDNNARPEAAVTEPSINTLRSRPVSPSISESAELHPNAPSEPSIESISKLTSSASGQNTRRNRIKSRDVKIPTDQEALLSRADSWLPAEPGQREPTTNIPISLLKTLNREAILRAQRPTNTRKSRNGTMTPSAVIDQTTDSGSDVPVSSGQWPASPERDQLPPDSSWASAELSDHSVKRILKNHRSVSSSRRQSHASISSRSVSPGLLSSSVASNSADEEVHRFKSPTPGSDLELTLPIPLDIKTGSMASSAPMQFPSTASQPQDPFTQVKRTPYVNGHVYHKSLSGSRNLSSPSKTNFDPLINGTANDDTEFVSVSVTSGPETSTAGFHGENGSSGTVDDQGIGNVAANLPEESNSQNVTDSILEKPDELIAEVQQEPRKENTAADKLKDSSHIMAESRRQVSWLDQPTVAANANVEIKSIPEQLPTSDDIHTDPLIQPRMSDPAAQITHEMKRKVADSSFVSPSVTKRQKRFKVPSTFNLNERSEVPRDPSERARQYRQDFLASRRSSESSTPTMSPTMPFTILPGTTSETPRNPAERARQIRQEFLASRRSSESSSPTMSPRMQFTALTGTTHAEQRNAEVENNVEKMNLQYQSVDPEIERQKTELKELPPSPQMQEMELDAAPLPIFTAYIEPDGDNAKPSAQANSSFDHKAESRLFVAQNADVEGADAEQSTVVQKITYASNDEAHRAQSVDLDVSFQSSDHEKADNDPARANDDADQIVDSEIGLMAASNDRLANINEEGRPVDRESGEASKDLSTRPEKVVEQASNSPTSEIMLNQAAHPGTTALKPLHQQQLIEENSNTQTPDKIASKPPPQQQSVTVDTDTSVHDSIATDPMLQQRLIEVDTDIPMPDMKVDRDNTPLKPITHTGEPVNQTSPPSIAVPAFVAKANPDDQPRLPPVVLEPAIQRSSPVSLPEVKVVEEHQNEVQLPNEMGKRSPLPVPQNIFDLFKATYTAYPGDIKHFAAMCRKISQLVKASRMAHQSLWDDFIVRHKIEYSQYLRRCAEEAEDVVPYEDFYQTEIEEPQYQKRVINRRNLDEALALVAQKPSVEKVHIEPVKDDEPCVKPVEHNSASESDPVLEKMHHEYTPATDDKPRERMRTESVPNPATLYEIVQKPSISRVTIDLTDDDPPVDQLKKSKERGSPPQPSIPHLVNGVSVKQSPSQYRRESSGSIHQVAYTPATMRGSHIPTAPQSMRSPLVPASTPTINTTKSVRRSLPWKESDRSVLQSSSNATASDFPKRFSSSEVRDDGSSNARLQVSAKSSLNGAKQSQGLLNTCHRIILSNWGIKAHELLEPEYYRGQVLSEGMIELLAEIASKVNVSEARYRIKEAIETRIRDNTRRGAVYLSQDRKMWKSDLEVVRGVVQTSSMSTKSPFSLPHTNAAIEKQNKDTPKWWDDDNSPFKSFARAYASIRPGNGNSFAEADVTESEDAERVYKAASGGVQLKKIDIMRWNL